MTNQNPFFILGCVRSGTTLLRDLLRKHPNLECPEETHFFRWADPFGTLGFTSNYARKKLFKEHRELDKVANFDFFYTMKNVNSRRELMDFYGRMFLQANNAEEKRWFDKTPQNVYGILLLGGQYPHAKFIHIHRHPYNVIASLKSGRMLAQQELVAAINYWNESLTILSQYKLGFPQRLLEIHYEHLTTDPHKIINSVLAFVGETGLKSSHFKNLVHEEQNRYREVLSDDDIATINTHCGPMMDLYGYTRK